jgi:hypothetical protein
MSTGSFLANKADTSPVPECNRPVKPRKRKKLDKLIMAIDKGQVLLENGETYPFSDLPLLVRTQPSSIVVAHHFGEIIRYLDSKFDPNPLWQYRASPIERTAWAPGRKHKAVMKDCIINYFGFKGERKQVGHYHYPLSPHIFCLKSVNELRKGIPGETATIVKLMKWAVEVRDFLQAHNLNLSPTSGGIGAQLLRDEKFYPSPRRKVPRHTNAKVRQQLPGNYYHLYAAKEGRSIHQASYLDQTAAHHTAAMEIDFPSANTLMRHGRYSTLEDKSFAKYGTIKYDDFISRYGLFYLAFETPRFFDGDFPLPNCGPGGEYHRGFFYSNELAYLKTLKVRIRHIIACWVSPDRDTGLNKYAAWAIEQVNKAPSDSKRWLKPTLLSTYGVLAAKPKHLESGYKHVKNGEPKKYPCGSGFIDVEARRSKKAREPLMANVIHRGMIEAQTRLRSLEYARELTNYGYTILAIYADSIFVESTKDLPFIEPPWRVQEYLTTLRFQSATHFTSQEISKTPGLPENWRNRAKLPPRPKGRKRGEINPSRAVTKSVLNG